MDGNERVGEDTMDNKKKATWNEIIFNVCVIFYIVYVVVYHNAYYNSGYEVNETFARIEGVMDGVFGMLPVVNGICQIIALFQKKWRAVVLLLVGLIAFVLAVGMSWGMSV